MQTKQIENLKELPKTNNKDVIKNQILEGKKFEINICRHNKRIQFLSRMIEFSNSSTSCYSCGQQIG